MSKGGSGGFTHEPNIRKDEKGRHDPRCPDTWSGFGEPVTVIMLMRSLPVRGTDLWPVGENLNDSAHRGCMAGEGADEGIFTRLIGNAEENRFRNPWFQQSRVAITASKVGTYCISCPLNPSCMVAIATSSVAPLWSSKLTNGIP